MAGTNNAINLSQAGITGYDGNGNFVGTAMTSHSILTGGTTTDTIAQIGPLTDGQLVIGSTGVAPVASQLTAGTGISITNAAGSITITATAAPTNFPYTVVTGATQALDNNNGYIANAASGGVTFTLPATAAVGDFIQVDGLTAGSGWTIHQGAGQQIQLGTSLTTSGAGGSLTSQKNSDCVGMVCAIADLYWIAETPQGNITVV